MTSLHGAVAVITGAGHGIGQQIVWTFAAAGARVVAVDINEKGVTSTASSVPEAMAVVGDVTSAASVESVVRRAIDRFGRIDVVVSCAGLIHVAPLLDHPLDEWRRIFSVNVEGPLLITQAAGGVMVEQESHPVLRRRGQIINVSSPAALFGRPATPAYGASKAALNHLSMSSALVLGPRGVGVTVLYPGDVKAGMWAHLGEAFARVEGRTREEIESERTFQDVEETAAIALTIASRPGLDLNGMVLDDVDRWAPIGEALANRPVETTEGRD